jgi:hypothetical protein
VRLGSAPLGAGVRVIAGEEIRDLFRQLAKNEDVEAKGLRWDELRWDEMVVPERITVRRAGARASCAELVRQILAVAAMPVSPRYSASTKGMNDDLAAGEIECGETVPRGSGIELMSMSWDPPRRSWEARARCRHPQDCVPFLVRWPGADNQMPLVAGSSRRSALTPASVRPMASNVNAPLPVRPGQKATLLWEQDGIRVEVPAVSLDRGGTGDSVRARIAPSGRILHAIVVSANLLRVAS